MTRKLRRKCIQYVDDLKRYVLIFDIDGKFYTIRIEGKVYFKELSKLMIFIDENFDFFDSDNDKFEVNYHHQIEEFSGKVFRTHVEFRDLYPEYLI